jgi:hypothetical protein
MIIIGTIDNDDNDDDDDDDDDDDNNSYSINEYNNIKVPNL